MRKSSPAVMLFLLFLVVECIPRCDGSNILGVFCTHSPSHLIVHMAMMKTLADRGHNITVVISGKPRMSAHENITVVLIPPTPERIRLSENYKASNLNQPLWKSIVKTALQSEVIVDGQYEFLIDPNFRKLYENPQTKFDLVILGVLSNDFQLGIAAKLRCPVIIAWVRVPMPIVDIIVGNIHDPAYVPSVSVGLEPGQNTMSFSLRLKNVFQHMLLCLVNEVFNYKMNQLYKQAFANETDPEFPSYYEMKRRISLLFYNYHAPSEGPIRPTVPQSIEIGGIQVKEQPDPLPKDLAEFLDKAKDGAIFFSLGTNVDTSTFSPRVVDIIYKVLSKLPQRVIWKWGDLKNTPGNSSNIFFSNWLPQDDILAHPKTKLFITHAGKGGVTEAQYHGVPMVALPLFGDQQGNAEIMAKSGFGLWLNVPTLTEEDLYNSIHEVLNNPTYRENIGKFSELYRDRPLTARESVVYWTEYVIRHHGAYHLQSPLIHMNFVTRNNLDVYGVFILFGLIFIILPIIVLRWVFRKFSKVDCDQNYRKEMTLAKLKNN